MQGHICSKIETERLNQVEAVIVASSKNRLLGPCRCAVGRLSASFTSLRSRKISQQSKIALLTPCSAHLAPKRAELFF